MTNWVTRKEWSARNPTSTAPLDWNRVEYFVIHYSGGPRNQGVRSIQNWCMNKPPNGKGHSDIDYNELIRGVDVYEGRGDNVGGHTYNLNSRSYGVCIIGLDGDATEDDLRSLQERYAYACGRAGRKLTIVGHRNAPNQKPTSCPGSELLGWIADGLIDDSPATPGDPGSGLNWTESLVKALPTVRLGHHSKKTTATVQGLVNRDAASDGAALLLEDGVFGPKTDARVRQWQAKHNVPNSVRSDGTGDGAFGPACWTYALTLD